MKKLMAMIALAAISFGSVYAQTTDTTKKQKQDTTKKTKQDTSKKTPPASLRSK